MTSLSGDDLVSNGDPLPPRARQLLAGALAEARGGQLQTDGPLLRIDNQGTKPYVLAWSVPGQTRALTQPILGIVADAALITDIFTRIVKQSPLLPPSLGGGTQELLTVRVSNDSGREIFASSSSWSQYASENVLERELGEIGRAH